MEGLGIRPLPESWAWGLPLRRGSSGSEAQNNEVMALLYGMETSNVRAADTGELRDNPVQEGDTDASKDARPLVAMNAEK